jgi:hypothetical protein
MSRKLNFREILLNADKLVEDYLLFRGFMHTHRTFVSECSRSGDRLQEFQIDKIVEELLRQLTSYNFEAMMDLWNFLDERYLIKLEHRYGAVVKHLELSLQRFYIVNAIQCGQAERAREVLALILEKSGDSCYKSSEWLSWFALPYLKDPLTDPLFKSYFTKEWASLLVVSIHNVLTTALQLAPPPDLLSISEYTARILHLESKIAELEDRLRPVESLEAGNLKFTETKDSCLPENLSCLIDSNLRKDLSVDVWKQDIDDAENTDSNAAIGKQSDSTVSRDPEIDPESAFHSSKDFSSFEGAGLCIWERDKNSKELFSLASKRNLPGHSGRVNQCSVSGDGATLASVSDDCSLRLCSLPGASPAQADRAATILIGSPGFASLTSPAIELHKPRGNHTDRLARFMCGVGEPG